MKQIYLGGISLGENYYKPSNRFTFLGFIMLVVSTAIIGSLLSIVYLKINQLCPFIYLTILIACGYGFVLGFVANFFVKTLKLRNPGLAILAMLIGGLIFTYFKWSFYILNDWRMISEQMEWKFDLTIFDILKDPKLLWQDIVNLNSEGRWGIGSNPTSNISGVALWIVWAIEAAMLIFIPAEMVKRRSSEPFIENENEWAKEYKNGVFNFEFFDLRKKKGLISNNPSEIFNFKSISFIPQAENYVSLLLRHSEDFNECFITLSNSDYNKKNKKNEKHEIIQYLRVDAGFVSRLFDYCGQPKPFASAYNYQANSMPVTAPLNNAITQPQSFEEFTANIDQK